ncbi:uncharacterized protein LOC121053171 [Rosa chinensis]|uniref:uncharacterized protein LOC121053171 n=1 Tax=Rosa chinensis TaxID=74649 RepID=UPI001AD92846|nr:uncharacterized protein LOC121053171 [Rosa chinensis]
MLCGFNGETTIHLCRDCPFTEEVMQSRAILKQVCYNPQVVQSDLLGWLNFCAKELSLRNFGEFMFLLWGVWKERNERVWNQKSTVACDVSLLLVSRLQEFRFHNLKQTQSTTGRARVVRWCAPKVGFLKINVGGSFNHITRQGGLGFVVRNAFGHILGGACPLSGLISPEHVEILASKRAAEFAADHAFLPAVLETDASEVKRQLTQHIGVGKTL